MLCEKTIRFSAIAGKTIVEEAQKTHALSRVATAALGRQLLMTAVMAAELKNPQDTVTTVIAGDGPAGNLVCVGRYGGFVKGYAQDPSAEIPLRADGKLDVGGYVGHTGKLSIIRDLGLKEPYVGLSNLVSGEVAEDFAQYFTASEQQPSLVYLGVRERADNGTVLSAGGILIQPMPGCPESEISRVEDLADVIPCLSGALADGKDLEDAVSQILGPLEPEVTERIAPAYRCDCSRKRLERALLSIGKDELIDILEHEGEAELTCQFCLKKYHFDRTDLKELLKAATDGE